CRSSAPSRQAFPAGQAGPPVASFIRAYLRPQPLPAAMPVHGRQLRDRGRARPLQTVAWTLRERHPAPDRPAGARLRDGMRVPEKARRPCETSHGRRPDLLVRRLLPVPHGPEPSARRCPHTGFRAEAAARPRCTPPPCRAPPCGVFAGGGKILKSYEPEAKVHRVGAAE